MTDSAVVRADAATFQGRGASRTQTAVQVTTSHQKHIAVPPSQVGCSRLTETLLRNGVALVALCSHSSGGCGPKRKREVRA